MKLVDKFLTGLIIVALTATIFVLCEVKDALALNEALKAQIETQQQPASTVIEGPYTVIINHSATAYANSIEIPEGAEVFKWTDVNGVKVIDVAMGSTFVRYVEGHIQGPQLALYAPYLEVQVISEKVGP